MQTFLAGKKTFISLGVLALGLFGFGKIISEEEAAHTVDLVLELIGLIGAVYGRIVARPK